MNAPCPTCGRPWADATEIAEAIVAAGLTPFEGALLLFLARSKGGWVRSNLIAAHLWANDLEGGPDNARDAVVKLVKRTREKLAAAEKRLQVETLLGTGFRLVAIEAKNHTHNGGFYRVRAAA